MDFFEAMEAMKEGAKVKLKSWPEEKYIGIKEEEKKIFGKKRKQYTAITSDELDVSPCLPFSVLVSSQWEQIQD
jgi:hypothetical protein